MKETLLNNWNFIRALRLGIGLYFAIQSVQTQQWLLGLIALLFIVQAVTNTGCCGGFCSVPAGNKNKPTNEDITFEEIKEHKQHP